MTVSEDATLSLTLAAIDDASDTINALRATIQSTADANAQAGAAGKDAGAEGAAGMSVWKAAIKDLGPVVDFVKGAVEKLGEVAGITGIALDLEYRKALGSAVAYAEATERVAFVTGLSTEKADGLIAAFRSQGMTTDEAAGILQRLEMRLGAFGTAAGKSAAEAEKLQKEIDKGGKTAEAARQKLELLDNQTGGSITNMRELGLTYADVTGHGRSMDQLLPVIIDHLNAMTDPMERARLASQLFGRNYGEIAPLLAAGGAAFATAEGDASKYGNSLSKDQVEALHAFKAAQEQAREAIDGFTGDMAMKALPLLKGIEDAVRNMAGAYDQLSPHVRSIIQDLLALVAVAGPLLGAAVALGSIGAELTKLSAMEGAVGSIAKLFGAGPLGAFATALAPLLPILAGVAIAILAVKLAYDNIKPVHEFIDAQLKRLTAAFQWAQIVFHNTGDVIVALEAFFYKLGVPIGTVVQWTGYLRAAWEDIQKTIKPLIDAILPALQRAWIQLQPSVKELMTALKEMGPVWDVLGPIFAAMGAAALVLLNGAFKALVGFLTAAIPAAIQLVVDVIKILIDIIMTVVHVITNLAKIVMDIVHGDWKAAWNDALNMVLTFYLDVFHIFYDLVSGIANLIQNLVNIVVKTIDGFVSGIIESIQWLADQLVGHSIIPDMINAIVKWFESLPDRVLGIIQTLAVNMVKAAETIGINIITGIVNGLSNLDSAMSHAIGRAINSVPGIGGQVDAALGLPTYDMGGWVNAPLGAPQLAVVHGGEFVQSRSMLAAGVSGSSTGGGRSGDSDLVVNVVLDGKVIQRYVQQGIGQRMRLQGGHLGAGA